MTLPADFPAVIELPREEERRLVPDVAGFGVPVRLCGGEEWTIVRRPGGPRGERIAELILEMDRRRASVREAMGAGAAARKEQAWSDALAGAQGGKAGEGFVNAGVMNVYGAFSGSARARPARPSGTTPAERAQR